MIVKNKIFEISEKNIKDNYIILYNFLMIVYQSIIYFMLDCIYFFNDKK